MTESYFMTFDEWVKAYPEVKKIYPEEKCEECNGQGIIICSECGHMVTCGSCHGTGKDNSKPYLAYEKMLEKEQKLYKNFKEKRGEN
ncbi:MAG: hypothetical protein WCY30_02335 [Candidatus Neomarinimicrobiota bacterium]|jgi:DnaJ-class molecular chaperone